MAEYYIWELKVDIAKTENKCIGNEQDIMLKDWVVRSCQEYKRGIRSRNSYGRKTIAMLKWYIVWEIRKF